MIFKFCEKGTGKYYEITFENRLEVIPYVYDHMNQLQEFATPETGNIYGFASEKVFENGKEIAILYHHNITGLIWIDTNNWEAKA